MGSLQSRGAPDGFSLPGVPWTSFFVPETGVALHGKFWHKNFGVQMSHGRVNMRNDNAKWVFRRSAAVWEIPVQDRFAWDRPGYGTRVDVH